MPTKPNSLQLALAGCYPTDRKDEPTKLAVAKLMGISERHLHRMLRDKTASREKAEQLAKHLGGAPEDYLRASRPKAGRSKKGCGREEFHYPFRDFVDAKAKDDEEGVLESSSAYFRDMIQEFQRLYRFGKAPSDFETLEHLLGFMTQVEFYDELRADALPVWQAFKIWRIEQECAERIFDVEMGDDVS